MIVLNFSAIPTSTSLRSRNYSTRNMRRHGARFSIPRMPVPARNCCGLSAMEPTSVLKDGKLFLVLGSPGGRRIITTVANNPMGMVHYCLDVQQAVNAPRFHHQWQPDQIYIERTGLSPDTIKLLQTRGHKLETQGYWSDGECIAIDARTGERLGAPDGRGGGKAVGY